VVADLEPAVGRQRLVVVLQGLAGSAGKAAISASMSPAPPAPREPGPGLSEDRRVDVLSPGVRALIVRLAIENPTWDTAAFTGTRRTRRPDPLHEYVQVALT
jgi:hypothetical protein